ncbi:MAG: methyltransferase domain-containing protein [Planctomycetaceae bacterium]|nr:methyltransferase domain-containing protein [Planctomycetaceae bacterium]
MMSTAPITTKDFGPIRNDYEFFQNHSTEHAADLAAYRDELTALIENRERLRMLDFGCGDGRFTATCLEQWGVLRDRLKLALVEPQSDYRRAAIARLHSMSNHPLQSAPSLSSPVEDPFDLILSNHVLYYVPDLEQTIDHLLAARAAGGRFVTAMAGRENALIQFWIACFAMLDRPVPYHLADDLEAILRERGAPFRMNPIHYELTFDDCEEHRAAILRFLLGDHFAALPQPAALDLFQPYMRGPIIHMTIEHRHFVVSDS